MSTTDQTASDLRPQASDSGPARMDAQTTQQMVREMTTLTSALFSLLQPHRAPMPETTTPQAELSPPVAASAAIVPAAPVPELAGPSIPLPDLPVAAPEAPLAPRTPPSAHPASIPLPSLPVPDLSSADPEPERETADAEDQPSKDGPQSMALMNEIAFLDD